MLQSRYARDRYSAKDKEDIALALLRLYRAGKCPRIWVDRMRLRMEAGTRCLTGPPMMAAVSWKRAAEIVEEGGIATVA